MVHFSMFGGHEGQLNPHRGIYVSIFGGTTLRRPPFAARLAELRLRPEAANNRAYFFFSLFGGAEVKWPTMATEYLALRESIRSGTLSLLEWDRIAAQHGETGALPTGSFALFGGFNADALPSEDEELDDLSLQRHAGLIPESVIERLMLGIGARGPQRLAAVRQALTLELQPPVAAAAPV
jgi:hypothetical protein